MSKSGKVLQRIILKKFPELFGRKEKQNIFPREESRE
ncbi:hypothetical protein Avbf_17395, partial [Armadillidium vulgare]